MPIKNIPTINNPNELQSYLKNSQAATKAGLAVAIQPRVPWNFQAVTQQGVTLLSWQAVPGADGYEVDINTDSSGDFSNPLVTYTVKLPGNASTTYNDPVKTVLGFVVGGTRSYRVRATAGTKSQPQSVPGTNSGVITVTAPIAASDTGSGSNTYFDTTTSDAIQAQSRKGNYFSFGKNKIT